MTEAERKELAVLAANTRDDRLRGLVFKLLEATADDRAVPVKEEHLEQPARGRGHR